MKKKFQSRKCTLLTWSEWFWHWRRWKRSYQERKLSNCCKCSNKHEIFWKRSWTHLSMIKNCFLVYIYLKPLGWCQKFVTKGVRSSVGAKFKSKDTSLQWQITIDSSFTYFWLRMAANYGCKLLKLRILLKIPQTHFLYTLIAGYYCFLQPSKSWGIKRLSYFL